MDPASIVGVAAAAQQFAEVGFKLAKLVRTIRDRVRDAPSELEAWRTEIEDLLRQVEAVEASPALRDHSAQRIIIRSRVVCSELVGIFAGLDFTDDDPLAHKTWKAIKGLDNQTAIQKHFDELQRLKLSLVNAVGLAQYDQGHRTAQDVAEIAANVRKLNFQSGSDEDNCLRDLFSTDPSSDRQAIITAKGDRVEGTCEWIRSNNEYLAWVNSSSGLLWISGGPGKGKTFMAIYLTRQLSALSNTLFFFFCDNKVSSRNTAVGVLRGLIYQLVNQHPHLLRHLLTSWKAQGNALFAEHGFETLWMAFETMLKELPGSTTCCVIDGLDECTEGSTVKLLHKFETLFGSKTGQCPLSLVILSRKHPDYIDGRLKSFPHIDLDSSPDNLHRDVESYITVRVKMLANSKSITQDALIKHIENSFRERSENTFLWVSFMADDLEKQSVARIEEALGSLPQGLDDIYKRILMQIRPGDREVVAQLLRWVTLASQPLTVAQLADALLVSESESLSKLEICLSHVRSCGHFLQMLNQDAALVNPYANSVKARLTNPSNEPTITFVHQSAKDFLLRPNKDPGIQPFLVEKVEGNLFLVHQLLSSMQTDWLQDGDGRERRFASYPLAWYASWHYIDHLRQLDDERLMQIVDEHKSFFSNKSPTRDWWHASMNLTKDLPILEFACCHGLMPIADRCLRKKRRTSPLFFKRYLNGGTHKYLRSPLQMSVLYGRMALVKLLLSFGAEVGSNLRDALLYHEFDIFEVLSESDSGRRAIAKDLQSCKAVIVGESLLHAAAARGSSRCCKLLIEKHGYDIGAAGNGGLTPLTVALGNGYSDLASQLVDCWDASPASADRIFEALVKAGSPTASHVKALEMAMVNWGIVFDTRIAAVAEYSVVTDVDFRETIIHLGTKHFTDSVLQGRTAAYEFLQGRLSFGADPFLRSANGNTPLRCYPWFRSGIGSLWFSVALLREGSSDINDRGHNGNTLLHEGVLYVFGTGIGQLRSGRLDTIGQVVQVLDLGADRAILNNQGLTALQLAQHEHDKIQDRRMERQVVRFGLSMGKRRREDQKRRKDHAHRREYAGEMLALVVDVLDEYATVANDPKNLDPLTWDAGDDFIKPRMANSTRTRMRTRTRSNSAPADRDLARRK